MVTEARLKRPTINILADIDHGKTVLLVFVCAYERDVISVQHYQCAANFSEIVKGFGILPNKFLHEWVPPCIACRNGKLRCGYSPDLLAILQGNPGRTTPVFASVATLAVLAILRFLC